MSSHCLLASIVSDEKPGFNLTEFAPPPQGSLERLLLSKEAAVLLRHPWTSAGLVYFLLQAENRKEEFVSCK